MKTHAYDGFSLVELMVAVAIVGILVSISVPQYQAYAVRSEVTSKVLHGIRAIQVAISEYVARYSSMPASLSELCDGVKFCNHHGGVLLPTDLATKGISQVVYQQDGAGGVLILITFSDPNNMILDGNIVAVRSVVSSIGSVLFSIDSNNSSVERRFLPTL